MPPAPRPCGGEAGRSWAGGGGGGGGGVGGGRGGGGGGGEGAQIKEASITLLTSSLTFIYLLYIFDK